ncbi:hypothetical protein AOL_s00068g1 [Orbilia oligospora ATCC 24927]|uniref:Uncharacterized protein n=1 Tax=Arthrobotrys oligospora (strain ATCC 24927 / CBS 115.81 / DSM 1491) TaxID=756982 RepID=G1X801_ARTOA|nr:hypothetical protein AOL_s00068g1 [Orbilia oligospora ATCC 24927]EGX50725.1 hypothetical protein AOL_s00068g1 [Orbilia oligospora ATCC 24927]
MLVTFAYHAPKSGATKRAFSVNTSTWALWATRGVAGSMRREETKCKKPLAGTQLPAIVQPNPFEPSQPQRQCPTAVGLGPGSWQHPFRYCLTNTSLTVHRPALALSNARCRSPTTCDSLTGQRVGVHTPNPLTSENRLQPATGTDLENVDC